MNTLFDKTTRETVIKRINSLNQNSQRQWGKMDVYQMVKHCIQWEEMLLGKTQYKQSFIGRLFGKFGLKDMMKDEPVKHNLPTVPSFKITATGDVEAAKKERLALIVQHDLQEAKGFMHPFFGQLSAEQSGKMAYKHMDHHLRQFNA